MSADSAAAEQTPVVELRAVARRFPSRAAAGPRPPAAVEDLSLALRPGEVLALLGPSGCGKSTTLALIAGHERPDAGDVWLDGRCVATAARARPAAWVPPERRGIGMVFQDYALFPHLTAAQNVAFGLRDMPPDERERRVGQLLDAVGLADLAGRYPHQLSGGQQQRVALARAMAPRPRAVLLDEPFNTLDAHLRERVRRDLLALLRDEGVSVVLVTHDQDEALTSADRVAVMRAGRIEQVDRPTVLYNRPATRFVAEFVGEGTFVPAVVARGRIDTPFGAAPLAEPQTWLHQRGVDLLVRPDEVELEPSPSGNAVVSDRRARGSVVEYDLALRPDPEIDPRRLSAVHLHAHSPDWLEAGTPVQVRLALRHLVAFGAGEDRALLTRCLTPSCTCPEDG